MKNKKKKFQTKMTIEKVYSLLLTTLNSQITHDEMDADLLSIPTECYLRSINIRWLQKKKK